MLHVQTQMAVMSVPVTLDSLEMDSTALVRLEFNAFSKIFRGRLLTVMDMRSKCEYYLYFNAYLKAYLSSLSRK